MPVGIPYVIWPSVQTMIMRQLFFFPDPDHRSFLPWIEHIYLFLGLGELLLNTCVSSKHVWDVGVVYLFTTNYRLKYVMVTYGGQSFNTYMFVPL